ncbi:MAG: GMC family oxidoreductase [Rhodocyclaceae bacterium]|nr:GMC family oxidoreductase [Rhodocyclaceae bacterium]
MFIDARDLPDGSRLETDLAIVGAGPAGITIARALQGSGRDICLVESGGLTPESDTQALADGECAGIDYPLQASRVRAFGGSSHHWGGFCRPLDPIDFEARDWVPHSGWPFGFATLAPYYARACEILEIAPARFTDAAYWQAASGDTLPEPASGRVATTFVQFSPPTRFGTRYHAVLAEAMYIRVLLHANVCALESTADGRAVSGLAIRTLDGRRLSLAARTVVLATGGLENPRLLLLSDGVAPNGLGNDHDRVGRCFMEHPHLSHFAEIVVADLALLPRVYREQLQVDGRRGQAAFHPSASFLRQRRLLNATFMGGIGTTFAPDAPADTPLAEEQRALLRALGPLMSARGPAREGAPLGHVFNLGCACEQAPDPDSRVTLSTTRDALGLRRLRLDWRLGELDRRSFAAHVRALAQEFGALGIGRTWLDLGDEHSWPITVSGGNHHMGTTRMHADPHQGVVDADCRVHGIDNLYIAGSSVFPTGGAANPTLTLVALALRLADHLGARR